VSVGKPVFFAAGGFFQVRKRIVPVEQRQESVAECDWLDLGVLAEVEISSESPEHPIESALLPGHASGWRAGEPGRQVIRLLFSPPQKVTRIQLHFEEKSVTRTQEYVLRWSPDRDQPGREIVRQQWNFDPCGATTEREDYRVELPSAAVLELIIDPGLDNQAALASLESLRIG
jgi:hypothetical protein